MNKLTALIEAAKAANAFCNKCGYLGPDEPTHQGCDYMAKRTAVVPADTILKLCALLEKAEEALEETTALCTNYEAVEEPDGYQFTEAPAVIKQGNEALAAIKQWKEKT